MNTYWYCGVIVKGIDEVYSYISDNGEIPVGTYVEVPFGRDNIPTIGYVKTVGEYLEKNVPYPVEKTKHITRTVTVENYEEAKSLSAYYDDEDEFDDVDYYIRIEDWERVLEWACENHNSPFEHVIRKVKECYELCLKQGMPVAALNLGTFYYNGRCVEQDFNKAFKLYKTAADAGEIRAICNCGYCFYYGRHQKIDYAEAYKYFTMGVLLYNDANCLYKLGDMYLNGYGTEKNEKYAFKLYKRALDCFNFEADYDVLADIQFRIGKCMLKGIGTEIDVENAHSVLNLALVGFYQRRKTDNFVIGLIKSTKKLIAEAQEHLDMETTEIMKQETTF